MTLAPPALFATPTGPGVRLVPCGIKKLSRMERRSDGYTHVPVFRVEPEACLVCFGRRGTWAENVRRWVGCWECAG